MRLINLFESISQSKSSTTHVEGIGGAVAGGIAGGVITKTPAGVTTGAKMGSNIQDYFAKKEGVDPGMAKLFSWKAEVLKAYPALSKQIKFLSKPDSTISAEIPGQDRSYGVFDLNTEEGEVLEETTQRLDPKCWKGYRKSGTKMKGGVRVNNCVKIGEGWERLLSEAVSQLGKKK